MDVDMDAETALLVHANKVFFTAVELAAQKENTKAVAEFDKAIKLYNMLSVSMYWPLCSANLWKESVCVSFLPSRDN